MLDLARIRNNPQEVVDALAKKGYNADFTEIIKWDDERKATITEIEQLKAQKNKVSAQIPVLKKAGQPVEPIFDEMRKLGDEIAAGDAKINDLIAKINDALACMPNIPDPDLLPGEKENNKVIKIVGEQPKFDFPLKNHVDICTDLGMIDYERGVKLSGNGFWIYRGVGARLEWALLNYFVDEHLKDGYEFILPPYQLGYNCGFGAGQYVCGRNYRRKQTSDEVLCVLSLFQKGSRQRESGRERYDKRSPIQQNRNGAIRSSRPQQRSVRRACRKGVQTRRATRVAFQSEQTCGRGLLRFHGKNLRR